MCKQTEKEMQQQTAQQLDVGIAGIFGIRWGPEHMHAGARRGRDK